MGTRAGDIDPAIYFYLVEHAGMTIAEIEDLLNKRSGLKGIAGTNDMREILQNIAEGDKLAKLAVEIYTYRIKKYIGAYYAVLGHVDAIIFTAGIGENSPEIRETVCCGMERLGIIIDTNKNSIKEKGIFEIQTNDAEVKILVIPTNEELEIALQTLEVI